MTLQEAIQHVLKKTKRPLSAVEILSTINSKRYLGNSENEELSVERIIRKIKEYPSLFQNINGLILQTDNVYWKNLITGYWHLTSILKEAYTAPDLQFIVAVIFFNKRTYDINGNPEFHSLMSWYQEIITASDKMLAMEASWIDNLRKFENYHIGPNGIFEECYSLLTKLSHKKLKEILSIIVEINTSFYTNDEFGRIFEYLISLNSIDGYKNQIYQTPYSLRELMVKLLKPTSEGSLYDPVSGTGGLLIESKLEAKGLVAKGSEIDLRISQLGNMNVMMYGLNATHIVNENCFRNITNDERYTYIIADLPLNGVVNPSEQMELYQNFNLQSPKSKKGFGSMVLYVYSKLDYNGKAVITVSEGFLSAGGVEREVRQLLVNLDVVESIVSLPIGTLRPYNNAKASLIVLNKRKSNNLLNRIRFITATAIEQDSKSLSINTQEVINLYENELISNKNIQVLDISDLQYDANLSVSSYDTQRMLANHMLKEGSGKILSDLVEIRSGIQPEKTDIVLNGDIPIIKIENLSRDILDTILLKDVAHRVNNENRYKRSFIDVKCILIARIGDNLKATIFDPKDTNEKILIHTGVYALMPYGGEKEIDLEYLYYQLYTAFVLDQIKKKQLGAVMPHISITSLKQIIIPYVDKALQRNFIESQKANLITEERNRAEERLKALGYIEEVKQSETDIIKILTHQLRPIFLTINNLTSRIDRIAEREGIKELKEYNDADLANLIDPEIAEFAQPPENYSIKELINNLINDSKHLSDILSNVDRVMNFKLSADDLKEIDLLDFLHFYKQQKEVEINNRYTINVKGDHALVLINKASFKELLDQLLLNAENHGFKNAFDNKHYQVRFNIKYNKQRKVATIEYSNNGEPYKLTLKDFISPFEKSKNSDGSGIGGNYIYRIVQAHKGEISIKENFQKGFSLTIELPTKQIENYE